MTRTAMMILAASAMALLGAGARAADPWADFASYTGPAAPAGYDDPNAALGKPTLFTDPLGMYGGVVTPLNSSFGVGETMTIPSGGALTLRFAEPVTNDPLNPFGIDLIVFGNSFLIADFSGPEIIATGISAEGGSIEVSADGVNFASVPGGADGMFPTNAYADITTPFTSTPGLIEASFTRPVDPLFNPLNKSFAQIITGYNGAGGGLGIDIGSTGFSSISYVRISNLAGNPGTPEIDAVADVASIPEPTAVQMFFVGALILLGKSVRRCNVNAAT